MSYYGRYWLYFELHLCYLRVRASGRNSHFAPAILLVRKQHEKLFDDCFRSSLSE